MSVGRGTPPLKPQLVLPVMEAGGAEEAVEPHPPGAGLALLPVALVTHGRSGEKAEAAGREVLADRVPGQGFGLTHGAQDVAALNLLLESVLAHRCLHAWA